MTKSEGYTMTKKNCKRKLSVLLMALVFAATSAMATDITGVTGNGVFNIDPTGSVNNIGYRSYDNFNLSSGDTANLKFDSGINSFVNMVKNQVNIDGLLQTTKNGAFHNGEAVFVSPNGMVVGNSGVLNVGALSVYTPTPQGMAMLHKGFKDGNLTTTYQGQQINLMEAIGWHGNAPVTINGHVFSHGDVNVVARQFDLGANGGIAAGVNGTSADIFNALVNTGNTSNVNIRTYDRNGSGVLNISGNLVNAGNGDIKIQNRGSQGLNLTYNGAKITNANGDVYLVNSKGTMNLNGEITNKGGFTNITTGANSGALNFTGKVNSEGLKVLTQSAAGANIGGTIINTAKGVAITNKAGTLTLNSDITNQNQATNISNTATADKLILNSKINSSGRLQISNSGANGMEINGDITNSANTAITNHAGKMVVNSKIENTSGKMNLTQKGNGGLQLTEASKIKGAGDEVLIQNVGDGGLVADGTIESSAPLYLQSTKGAMAVNGSVTGDGKLLYVGNTGDGGLTIAESAKISNNNKIQIMGNGAGGMNINGIVSNTDEGTSVTNHKGNLTVNGSVTSKNGNITLTNKGDGAFVIADSGKVTSEKGQLLVQNSGANGFTSSGSIASAGPVFVQNTKGAMAVGGTVTGDGNRVYIGNTGDGGLTIAEGAKISNNNKIQIMGNGAGGMNINGLISNIDEGTAITNHKGNLTVNGSVTSKKGNINLTNKGDGALVIADSGKVTSEKGQLLVQNAGTVGLTSTGTIASAGPVFVQNTKGAMAVGGSVTGDGNRVYIGNTGDGGLTIAEGAKISNNNKIQIMGNGAGGMNINGAVSNNGGGTAVANYQGNMTVNGSVTSKNGDINLTNKGNGALVIADSGKVGSEKGQLVVQNSGANGLAVNGLVDNKGYTVMYNKGGDLNIAGDVKVTGARLSVHNTGDGALKVSDGATVIGEGLGRIYLTNTGKGGMTVDAPVVSGGHVLLTNRAGGMNVSSNVTSTKNNVVLTNTGDKNMVVDGTVRGNKVTAYSKGNDIVLGNKETNQIAINGKKKVFITTDDGSILNAGVDTHLIKSGGNLYMAANNGSIGEDVEGSTGVGADARDLTKSVNVYVNGRVKAFTTDEKKNSAINIASKGKDLRVDRIKADGKVLLLTDKAVDSEGNVKTGSILNAATELGDYANVKGTTVQLMSSGSIGTGAAPLHFRQTDASQQSNVLAGQDIYLHARGEEVGEDVNFNIIKSKGGSIDADIIRNGVVEQAVAPGNIKVEARKNDANLNVKVKSNDPNIIKDYFDAH